MKIVGIYGIRNMANGKWYIGQSRDVELRKYNHFQNLKRKRHCNPHLQSAFNKYGVDSFEFFLLQECQSILLDNFERAWISQYKSDLPVFGYNLSTGGNACKKLSESTRKRVSEAQLGVPHPHVGHPVSDLTRKKISFSRTGKKYPRLP
jgi:group I intron endonuclease